MHGVFIFVSPTVKYCPNYVVNVPKSTPYHHIQQQWKPVNVLRHDFNSNTHQE